MTDAAPVTDPPITPQRTTMTVSDAQIREAIVAAAEVLDGAGPARILQLVEKLALAKMITREIGIGNLVVGPAPKR